MRTPLLILLFATLMTRAEPFGLRASAIVPGAGVSSGGSFAVASVIGQAVADHSEDSTFAFDSGFFAAIAPNQIPIAQPDSVTRGTNEDFKVEIKRLLANDLEPDGEHVSILIPTASDHGVPLIVSRGWIYYSPVDNQPDSFTYTITDPHGKSAEARVDILIADADAQSSFFIYAETVAGGLRLYFWGIPTRAYTIQSSQDFNTWQDIGVATHIGVGRFEFIDAGADGARFYRIVYRE